MVKPTIEVGSTIDGFRVEERVHTGGMATLWRVSRSDLPMPMLMKLPKIGEGADPAAVVGFEMELMILPKLSGIHVPKFIAAGELSVRPYTVIERIGGRSLYARLPDLPLPYTEVAGIGVKVIVNPGGTNERFARANYKQLKLIEYPDNVTIFQQIVDRKADVMITDAS